MFRYGRRPDDERDNARDHRFRASHVALPAAVDLSQWRPPRLDQGDLSTCVEHGVTCALRSIVRKLGGKTDVPLSRLYLYRKVREEEKTLTEDDPGSQIRTGIKMVKRWGVPTEDRWPYDEKKWREAPPAEIDTGTQLFGSLEYERLPISVTAVKQALAEGLPVVIGVTLYDSFESDRVAANGIIPMPDVANEGVVGDHCMWLDGYRSGFFQVVNSWGAGWGDDGVCHMPESYIGSPHFGSDYWTIRYRG